MKSLICLLAMAPAAAWPQIGIENFQLEFDGHVVASSINANNINVLPASAVICGRPRGKIKALDPQFSGPPLIQTSSAGSV